MKFSQFFISRPIFAGVISLMITIAGAIAVFQLPISEYPEVTPPTVVVTASYPGANPTVIGDTVATPIEQAINGTEGMLYMSSQATSDGNLSITVTFELGTDVDAAQVLVQNRVTRALPRLPEEVQRLGVIVEKSSPDLTMVVHITSPDDSYDTLYLANYANLKVKDELSRLNGVGSVRVFGSDEYSMRIWLDPQKIAALNMTAMDVVQAIREQNLQAAAGSLGAQPSEQNDFQLLINLKGRLSTEQEFNEIVIKVGEQGQIVRLADVATVELGAKSYALRSLLNNKAAVALPVFQSAGANAIAVSDAVRAKMAELKANFPQGVDYQIVYDPTVFVRGSIDAVVATLFEALLLVVVVVVLFLQNWRAAIIPLAAVPVSLIGTFAVMHGLGFSLNALSLFGLVLAIGIVVDDAIVVVENVERNIEKGLSPVAASQQAMKEVTGPIIATTLVLAAVFIPTAFMSGLTGQFYKQFALTIAISTFISALNSLTLSPALSALLLRSKDAPKDAVSRVLDKLLQGWLFNPFNRFFNWGSQGYARVVKKVIRSAGIVMLLYVGLLALTAQQFTSTPTGYVPSQDKQYLVAFTQLPDAASLSRTEAVVREMSALALAHPGVESTVAFPGLNINGFSKSSSSGVIFVTLKPFEQRRAANLSAHAIAGQLNGQFAGIKEAYIAIFPPPPVPGMGNIGGFRLQLQDKGSLGYESLYQTTMDIINKSRQVPELAGAFTSFQVNTPQIDVDVDREKAKMQGVAVDDIFATMQVYLGSMYVNDFNKFGRNYQVNVQSVESFRQQPEQIGQLKVRNKQGDMIPLASFIKVKHSAGPDRVMHYNGFITAEINASPAPGYSSGQAQAAMEKLLADNLPAGIEYEWTDLTYQQQLAGNTAVFVFPLVVLLVFLVLAAQYESLSLPLAIILIVPMTLLSAIVGVVIYGGDNNIFTQIGFIVLVGLATKNAILIVEFAREQELAGKSVVDAILEASHQRLRPILMTSIAFIMGVLPLVISTGAGAEMRQAMGVAVFSGMIGVTLFGLLLTPVFYVLVRKYIGRGALHNHHAASEPALVPSQARPELITEER
ncbi:efflux RND transporter permease subunit [Dasania sp. GY-MA-18]|uniref:Efflux pump membrane transporter n=1 Tax=Dasania phycosphaerae TaxID=2950436 RepID=A0A9J6RGY4_9GAMM|nr:MULTISPECIES: efflux RND transporter permease subunit [Dasania]MCR8921296.1 efflux RND transporter permease subunit [Dasania sp. GY-MA-18]MCZ0863724.1 efflux RND transporter permease subunit [Dasania phycosphaerae]MCZ0867452.1 efflux RND transporter permease subunit [Dasania phycosphaerae]